MEIQVSKVDSDSVLNGLHGKKEKEMAIIECKGRWNQLFFWTGFELMASAITVQCSNNWAISQLGAGHIVSSVVIYPWKVYRSQFDDWN